MATFKSNKLQVFSTDETKNFLVDSSNNSHVSITASSGTVSFNGGTKLKVVNPSDDSEYFNDVYAKLKSLDDAISANQSQDLADQIADQVAE